MAFTLRGDLSFCVTDRQAVFLDLRQNRYFALPSGPTTVLLKVADRQPLAAADYRELAPLISRGLIQESEQGDVFPSAEPPPASQSFDFSDTRVPLPRLIEAILTQWGVENSLRWRGLNHAVRKIRQRVTLASEQDGPEARTAALRAAAAFDRAGILYPSHGRCLAKSLALVAYLARRNCHPSLIFGVRVSPFSAHCWVQFGGIVLNDSADHIRTFKPILVL